MMDDKRNKKPALRRVLRHSWILLDDQMGRRESNPRPYNYLIIGVL